MPHVNCGEGKRALAADSFSPSTWGWTPWLDSVSFLLTGKSNSCFQVIVMHLPQHTLCFWSTLTISSAPAFCHTCCTPTFQSPSSWSLLTFPSPATIMWCAFGRIRKGKEKLKQWLLPSKLQTNQSLAIFALKVCTFPLLQKPQHSHILAVSFLLLVRLVHLKAHPISATQGPWVLGELSQRQRSAKHAISLVMAVLSAVTDTGLQLNPSRLRARTSFEQGLIPLQGVSFLTPTTNSLFSSLLIDTETSKIIIHVFQNLDKTPPNKKQNLFSSCWRGRGCISRGQPLMCGGTGSSLPPQN